MKRLFFSYTLFLSVLTCYGQTNRLVSSHETIRALQLSSGPGYGFGVQFNNLAKTQFGPDKNWHYAIGYKNIFSNNIGFGTFFEYGNYQRTNFLGDAYTSSSQMYKLFLRSEKRWSWGERNRIQKPHSVYPFAGIGFAGGTVALTQKMNNVKDNFCAFIVPFGIGYNYQFSQALNLGFEIGAEYLASDTNPQLPGNRATNGDLLSKTSIVFSYSFL